MSDKFDELAKALAQPVARRAALKRFGVGLAGMALTTLGLGRAVAAQSSQSTCCIYERYYPTPIGNTHGNGTVKLCQPPGATCATTIGGWDTYQYRLVGQKAVSNCNSCK